MTTIKGAYGYDGKVLIEKSNQSLPTSFSCREWLKTVWRWVDGYFATANDPKVSTKVDRQGNVVYWQVFDPAIGRTVTFGSELEVRSWLECRYFR